MSKTFQYSGDGSIPGKGGMSDLEYCHFRQSEAGEAMHPMLQAARRSGHLSA